MLTIRKLNETVSKLKLESNSDTRVMPINKRIHKVRKSFSPAQLRSVICDSFFDMAERANRYQK